MQGPITYTNEAFIPKARGRTIAVAVSADGALRPQTPSEFMLRYTSDVRITAPLVGETVLVTRNETRVFCIVLRSLYWERVSHKSINAAFASLRRALDRESVKEIFIPMNIAECEHMCWDLDVYPILETHFGDWNGTIRVMN